MAQAFIKGSNLRALVTKLNCPMSIRHCAPIFARLFGCDIPDDSNVITEEDEDDVDPIQAKRLDAGLVTALRKVVDYSPNTLGFTYARYRQRGRVLSRVQTHRGNSQVFFKPFRKTTPVPGQIQAIFRPKDDRGDVFVALRRHNMLPPKFSILISNFLTLKLSYTVHI
jgi:hypothetical protein